MYFKHTQINPDIQTYHSFFSLIKTLPIFTSIQLIFSTPDTFLFRKVRKRRIQSPLHSLYASAFTPATA